MRVVKVLPRFRKSECCFSAYQPNTTSSPVRFASCHSRIGFRRRILPVVIQIHDVRAARVAPAGEHGVVLAVVARVFDQGDGDLAGADELPAHVAGGLVAAVVHENDLVPAVDLQRLDVVDDGRDRRRAPVQRNDEAQRRRLHAGVIVERLLIQCRWYACESLSRCGLPLAFSSRRPYLPPQCRRSPSKCRRRRDSTSSSTPIVLAAWPPGASRMARRASSTSTGILTAARPICDHDFCRRGRRTGLGTAHRAEVRSARADQ